MEIINFFDSNSKADLLKQIKACDWSAASFLAELLEKETFNEILGGWGDLFLLMDGEKIVSYATYAAQDSVRDESLTPWIGFVFTQPEYRGHRYAGRILAHAEAKATSMGYSKIYIATDYVDLYEKFGYSFQENRIDCWGDEMRVLYKDLKENSVSCE